jgi:ABC-2 type transport system permease protein
MRNTYLIARREYLERIRTRAFAVMTVLVPLLMLAFTVVPSLMAGRSSGTKHIAVVASDLDTAKLIQKQLEIARQQESEEREASPKEESLPKRRMPEPPRYKVDLDTDTSASHRAALTQNVRQQQLDGVVWAPAEALAARRVDYITRDTAILVEKYQVESSVDDARQQLLLKKKGLTDAEIKDFSKPVKLDVQGTSGGAPKNVRASLLSLIFLTTILYVTVLLYGVNVMNAVLEDKTSRVMEVMLASASPRDLMAGKILGVGAVGLTQIAIWAVAGIFFSGALAAGAQLKEFVSITAIIFFAVFFLFGYGLYSTLYATIGAMVNSQQEGQQLQQLVALPLALSFVLIFPVIQSPNSPMAMAVSFFPLTAPLMMFARVVLQTPPWWQIALCIGLLLATIFGVVLICAKIYRVGILMYGKRPTLPEIMKWLKYA